MFKFSVRNLIQHIGFCLTEHKQLQWESIEASLFSLLFSFYATIFLTAKTKKDKHSH